MKLMHNMPIDLEYIGCGTSFWKGNKKTISIKSYHGQKIVETHDRQRPKGIQQV